MRFREQRTRLDECAAYGSFGRFDGIYGKFGAWRHAACRHESAKSRFFARIGQAEGRLDGRRAGTRVRRRAEDKGAGGRHLGKGCGRDVRFRLREGVGKRRVADLRGGCAGRDGPGGRTAPADRLDECGGRFGGYAPRRQFRACGRRGGAGPDCGGYPPLQAGVQHVVHGRQWRQVGIRERGGSAGGRPGPVAGRRTYEYAAAVCRGGQKRTIFRRLHERLSACPALERPACGADGALRAESVRQRLSVSVPVPRAGGLQRAGGPFFR